MSPDDSPRSARTDDLAAQAPAKKTTVSWNAAVDRRLDQLVELASGTEPGRSDLLAALVALAPSDSHALDDLVLEWRRMKVRDVVLGVPKQAGAVSFTKPRRGRRPRRGGA